MIKKKKKSEITREYEFLKVDGRYFKPETDGDQLKYIEVSEKEYKNKVVLVKKIANKIKDSLDREKVMTEALSKLEEEYLEQIWGALNHPTKNIKAKTREHHCVDMKVGKMIIPIIN